MKERDEMTELGESGATLPVLIPLLLLLTLEEEEERTTNIDKVNIEVRV